MATVQTGRLARPVCVSAIDSSLRTGRRSTAFRAILLYGFGPYRRFPDNITAEIIKSLPPATWLGRMIFPVRFQRRQFIEALQWHRPEVVLGLGQSTRRHIEIEMRAINRRRAKPGARPHPIRAGGPRWLPTTARLRSDRTVRRSKNAGDYVCNFSMYVVLDAIRRAGTHVEFAFVHIPHDLSLQKATRAVSALLEQLGRGTRAGGGLR